MSDDARPSEGDRQFIRWLKAIFLPFGTSWENKFMSQFKRDDQSETVVIGTESRDWEGTPEEFIELRDALNEVEFIDGSE